MPLPTVLLHDHLDGGLRPRTVLELAEECGYEGLPATDESDLAHWFDQVEAGSLEAYLEAFRHTLAVMQTAESLERVAYEAAVDLAEDGVVYAEIRFGPMLHLQNGLGPERVVEAVASGMRSGAEATSLRWGLILDALRHMGPGDEVARLAIASRRLGVVGFDIAGPESGHPPRDQLAACRLARESGLRLTVHAGEAAGPDGVGFIAQAMDVCGAERLGHGVQIVDDCVVEDGRLVSTGRVAARVRERRLVLEMCPSSNLATGRLAPEDHPIGLMHRAGFMVTINTDNRLMSRTSMAKEQEFVQKYQGFSTEDLATCTRRALDAAFCPWETKAQIWEDHIAPAYREAGVSVEAGWR